MSYIRKTAGINTPAISKITYKIPRFYGLDAETDESALDLSYGIFGYNIGFKGGTLISGPGINVPYVYLPDGTKRYIPYAAGLWRIRNIHLYRTKDENGDADDRIIVRLLNNKFYYCKILSGDFVEIAGITSTSDKVSFLNYYMDSKNILLITTPDGVYKYDGETVTAATESPGLTSVCMHYHRLFGLDASNANRIHFSNDLNPLDYTISENGAGYIDLMDEGGAIEKLVSFNDYIFVFREHAIHRLTAYTSPSDYKLTKVFETNRKIAAKTITVADDRIIFMADKSLYSFDGYNAVMFGSKLTALIDDHTNAVTGFYKNRLYLAAKLKTRDGVLVNDELNGAYLNNGMLVLDMQTGDTAILRGADIAGFMPLNTGNISHLLCIYNNYRAMNIGMIDETGLFYGAEMPRIYVSPKSDLGSMNKYKIIRSIYITTLYDITLTVDVDGAQTSYKIKGSPAPQRLVLKEKGESVSILFESKNNIYVSNLMMECDLIRRYYAD